MTTKLRERDERGVDRGLVKRKLRENRGIARCAKNALVEEHQETKRTERMCER